MIATKQPKWNTGHFPADTTFTVNDDIGRNAMDGTRYFDVDHVFTATHLINNGPGSYVVCTTDDNPSERIGGKQCYNIDHVKAIIKRGTGPVKIGDERRDGTNTTERVEYVQRFVNDPELCQYKKKNEYMGASIRDYLMLLIDKYVPEGSIFDMEKAITALHKAGIYRITYINDNGWCDLPIMTANKKRLHKWLKQNTNRFLRKLKEVQAEEAKDWEEAMEESWDRDFDDH